MTPSRKSGPQNRLPAITGANIEQAYVARNLAEAHLIKGYLESEGLSSEVRGEHLMAAYGEIPMTMDTLPSIWVTEGERTRARHLIEKALQGGPPDSRWVCPGCDEVIDGQFTDCWQCGAPRPISE